VLATVRPVCRLQRLDRVKRIAFVLILMLVACSRRTETPRVQTPPPVKAPIPSPPAPIRTDRSHFVLTNGPQGPETTIVATLRAPADRAVYIVNCNGATGVTLQRKVGEEWVWSWLIAMNACLSPPIVVPAGGEHTASIYVHERSGAVLNPKHGRMIESGTYRVVWTGVLTAFDTKVRGFGPELPLEQRVSAPITIEVPPVEELTPAKPAPRQTPAPPRIATPHAPTPDRAVPARAPR
jgi:hypothetical protein